MADASFAQLAAVQNAVKQANARLEDLKMQQMQLQRSNGGPKNHAS